MYITNSQLELIQKKFKKITFPNDGLVMINQEFGLMSFNVPSCTKDICIYIELDSFWLFNEDNCIHCPHRPEECPGVYIINKPNECLIAPQEVADLWEEDDCIDDWISLKIPDQTYTINFRNYEVNCYMEFYNLYGILFATTLPFTNIHMEGKLCFDDNQLDIINDINSGRFSSILEVFWASEFNHDLASDTLLLENSMSYTSKFHQELRTFLLKYFNPGNTNEEIIEGLKKRIDPYCICFGDILLWKSYLTSTHSFYILSSEKYIVLLAIEINSNFMTTFKFKKSLST